MCSVLISSNLLKAFLSSLEQKNSTAGERSEAFSEDKLAKTNIPRILTVYDDAEGKLIWLQNVTESLKVFKVYVVIFQWGQKQTVCCYH